MRSLIIFVTLLALTSSAQAMLGLEYGPSLGKLYGHHGLELKKLLGAEKAISWPYMYYLPIAAKEKEHGIGFGKELGVEKGLEHGKELFGKELGVEKGLEYGKALFGKELGVEKGLDYGKKLFGKELGVQKGLEYGKEIFGKELGVVKGLEYGKKFY